MNLHDFTVSPRAAPRLFGVGAVEERLSSLEAELRDTEYRIRRDLLERDRAWRERIASAMCLVCRMLAEAMPPSPPRHHPEAAVEAPEELPIADLQSRAITLGEYHANAPEKFELLEGYLFDAAEHPDVRRRLLALLLVNVGLVEAIRLAPEQRWREALARVYGAGGP